MDAMVSPVILDSPALSHIPVYCMPGRTDEVTSDREEWGDDYGNRCMITKVAWYVLWGSQS